MKRFFCFLLSLITRLSPAAEEAFIHPQTGISLPAAIAGLKRGPVQTYEAAPGETGVAIPFHGEEVEITLFIRSTKPGSPGTAQSVVDDSLSFAKQMAQNGTFSNLEVFLGEQDPENPQWAKGAYTARQDGAFIMSIIYGTMKEGFAVKARITLANPKQTTHSLFIKELKQIVNSARPGTTL